MANPFEIDEQGTDEMPADLGVAAGPERFPGEEARKFPRFPFRGRARAVIFPSPAEAGAEPQESEVLTTDLSRGGLSLLHRKELFPGQQVLLVLNDTNRLVEVRWCCRVWQGLYAAGCCFIANPAESPASSD